MGTLQAVPESLGVSSLVYPVLLLIGISQESRKKDPLTVDHSHSPPNKLETVPNRATECEYSIGTESQGTTSFRFTLPRFSRIALVLRLHHCNSRVSRTFSNCNRVDEMWTAAATIIKGVMPVFFDLSSPTLQGF